MIEGRLDNALLGSFMRRQSTVRKRPHAAMANGGKLAGMFVEQVWALARMPAMHRKRPPLFTRVSSPACCLSSSEADLRRSDPATKETAMEIRRIALSRVAAVIVLASITLSADALAAPKPCPNDSKLLNDGPTRISGDGPGTWWGLVNGLLSAGFVAEDEQIDYLNEIFDTDLDTLRELKAYNLQLVRDVWDENHNGYVCAFQLRGTRAYFHNPYVDLTFFGITDDRVAKN